VNDVFAQLDEAIRSASPEEVCAILGALVEREERLRLRLRKEPTQNGQAPLEERNLSAREAARRLGVSLPYLYKHAGEFPFKVKGHLGKRVLFDARGLEAWNRGEGGGGSRGR
jgi:hypothetical protein